MIDDTSGPPVAAWLAEELDRAAAVAPEALPPRVVTMQAQASYRDDARIKSGA